MVASFYKHETRPRSDPLVLGCMQSTCTFFTSPKASATTPVAFSHQGGEERELSLRLTNKSFERELNLSGS